MPEGKKLPAPAPVREEDSYSAKTHLHQPVQETATVAAGRCPGRCSALGGAPGDRHLGETL